MHLSNFLDLERGGTVIVQSNSTSLHSYYSMAVQFIIIQWYYNYEGWSLSQVVR